MCGMDHGQSIRPPVANLVSIRYTYVVECQCFLHFVVICGLFFFFVVNISESVPWSTEISTYYTVVVMLL